MNPKGCLVRQADRHACCQAIGPVGQFTGLITRVCVCARARLIVCKCVCV